jgi:preprotein translocase SecE subunit
VQNARYITLSFIGVAFSVGILARSAAVDVLLHLGKADSLVGGVIALSSLIAIGLGAVCFFGLLKWRTAVDFTNECVIELVKVTWPDREETTNSSMVVIVASLIFAGSLALFDYVWSQVTEIFLFSAS